VTLSDPTDVQSLGGKMEIRRIPLEITTVDTSVLGPGPVSTTASIRISDPHTGDELPCQMSVKALVVGKYGCTPPVLMFGVVNRGQSVTREVKVAIPEKYGIKARCEGSWLQVAVDKKKTGDSDYTIVCELRIPKDAKVGVANGLVTVKEEATDEPLAVVEWLAYVRVPNVVEEANDDL
jgi:hypothetical protein